MKNSKQMRKRVSKGVLEAAVNGERTELSTLLRKVKFVLELRMKQLQKIDNVFCPCIGPECFPRKGEIPMQWRSQHLRREPWGRIHEIVRTPQS